MSKLVGSPITIRPCATEAELYLRDPSATEARNACICIDVRERTMWAEPERDDEFLFEDFVLTFPIPPITASAASQIMQSIKSDATVVIDDWKAVKLTDSLGDYVELVLGDNAYHACQRIDSVLPKVGEPSPDRVLEWNPDVMPIGSARDLGIDSGTTTAELDAIEDGLKEVLGEAWPEAGTVLVWRGLREHLEQIWTRATGAAR